MLNLYPARSSLRIRIGGTASRLTQMAAVLRTMAAAAQPAQASPLRALGDALESAANGNHFAFMRPEAAAGNWYEFEYAVSHLESVVEAMGGLLFARGLKGMQSIHALALMAQASRALQEARLPAHHRQLRAAAAP